ncbi:MAG: serine hydrolase [Alphaproteobacteria bacterium]|nr:serine hydrolase [Alphaproteobacteria bacterium]MBV9418950.1 serine hydrolase [Alphaproteobacteria bacterium]MBV9540786.1 serine hydrolase [Alphaproteobacteria bacterium]
MRSVFSLAALLLVTQAAFAADYFPPKGSWATHAPEAEGFDPAKLQAAIDFAKASETKFPSAAVDSRDLSLVIPLQFSGPYSDPLGPLKAHAPANGIIIRHGYIVAEWGDTNAVDMAHSVTKTFLSTVAGVAFDRGLLPDVNTRVIDAVRPTADFMLPHNQPITWDQMLRQTSGWVGTMWGKPWWADRPGKNPYDQLAAGPPPVGTQWKYNDVRVNAFSLALTYIWKRPLPDVLRQYVMDPIGASNTWHWEGYRNSWTTIGGKRIHIVPGGGHWGGGMFISARDLARIGLMAERGGMWKGKRILSEKWIQMARTPTGPNPGYGYMNWFLNTDQKLFPAARGDAYAFIGNGDNIVFVDPEHDVVAVVRWIDDAQKAEFVRLLEAAIQ